MIDNITLRFQTAESAEERRGAGMVRHSANLRVLCGSITKTKELNIHIDSLKNSNIQTAESAEERGGW